MKLQDLYPFDSAILGLDGIYSTSGDDSFFINSNCIVTFDRIVTTGHSYVLVMSTPIAGLIIQQVDLVDAYYFEGKINLLLKDSLIAERFIINHCIECPESPSLWKLIDLDYLSNKIDEDIIIAYHGKNI